MVIEPHMIHLHKPDPSEIDERWEEARAAMVEHAWDRFRDLEHEARLQEGVVVQAEEDPISTTATVERQKSILYGLHVQLTAAGARLEQLGEDPWTVRSDGAPE